MITAAVLFVIGIYCLAVKRNMLKIVIGMEIVTSAVHLNFIALGAVVPAISAVNPFAQTVVIVSTAIGALVATVALMLIMNAYKHYGSLDVKRLSRLRW